MLVCTLVGALGLFVTVVLGATDVAGHLAKVQDVMSVAELTSMSNAEALKEFKRQLGSDPYLLFPSGSFIYRGSLQGSDLQVLRNDSLERPRRFYFGIDFDYRENYMFWSDINQTGVWRSRLSGSGAQLLISSGLTTPYAISWDWTNGKLYVIDNDEQEIEVYDPQTDNRKVLVYTGNESNPIILLTDPTSRWMYWSCELNNGSGAIERASMDGSGRTLIYHSDTGVPTALALDSETQTLYWFDAVLDRLESARPDGSNHRILSGRIANFSWEMSYFDGSVYWTDINDTVFQTADVNSPADITTLFTGGIPRGIRVVSPQVQPQVNNPCEDDNGGCQYLCLLSATAAAGFTCACPDGLLESGNERSCEMPQFGDLRLVQGNYTSSNLAAGRLEVYSNGAWGTICDDLFGQSEADVACHQLGYENGALNFGRSINEGFGAGHGDILLDNIQCDDGETQLISCSHNGVGIENCNHTEDIAVVCRTDPYLLLPSRSLIYQRNLQGFGSRLQLLRNDSLEQPRRFYFGIDFDYRENYMFWSDVLQAGVWRSRLSGSGAQLLISSGLTTPYAISWDWTNKKLYVVDVNENEIEVYDPQTDNRKVLVYTGNETNPIILLTDPTSRWMYWSCELNNGSGAIERASMDGSGRTLIYHSDTGVPTALALDSETQTLYWFDAVLDRLESARPDGSNHQILSGRIADFPWEMSYFEGSVYWTDINDTTICTADVNSPTDITTLFTGGFPRGIRVVSPQVQPQVNNPCEDNNGGCQYLCLLSATAAAGFTCACPDGLLESGDERNCEMPQFGDLRLVQGNYTSSNLAAGRLEVYSNGAWGTICDDLFGQSEANVACHQLGYENGALNFGRSINEGFGAGHGDILLDNVQCDDGVTQLISCSHNGVGIENCDHTEDIAVACRTDTDTGTDSAGLSSGAIAGVAVGGAILGIVVLVAVSGIIFLWYRHIHAKATTISRPPRPASNRPSSNKTTTTPPPYVPRSDVQPSAPTADPTSQYPSQPPPVPGAGMQQPVPPGFPSPYSQQPPPPYPSQQYPRQQMYPAYGHPAPSTGPEYPMTQYPPNFPSNY